MTTSYAAEYNRPLIGGIRAFADIIPSYVQFPDYESTRSHDSTIGRLESYEPGEPPCLISGYLDCHYAGIWRVYMTALAPIVEQALRARALPVPNDIISFKLIRRTDGLFLYYNHSQIIGGSCIAAIDPTTIPDAWITFHPLRKAHDHA